ncbi:MAG: hypothetical protein JW936_09525 [Sedimentisphaerales bacterium]|nr:hypothetical protein [Sedimentisphaerales bacterium]
MIAAAAAPHIPAYQHLALPAPAWLLVTLSTITFWIHLIFVSAVVGISCILLLRCLLLRNRSEIDRQINSRALRSLPLCISLAINFGVAPLLFTQCLYGPWFYTASIFIAPFWLAVLALLLIGFISTYLARLKQSLIGFICTLLMPLAFIAILYIMTNNSVLTIQPEHWIEFHRHTSALHVPDPIVGPRLLHNLAIIITLGGLAWAWLSRSKPAPDSQLTQTNINRHATRIGLQYFFLGLPLQIAFTIWYLQTLPKPLQSQLLHTSNSISIIWYASLFLIGLALLTGIVAAFKAAGRFSLAITTILTALSLAGNLIVRQHIRTYYLSRDIAGNLDIYNPNSTTGWQVQNHNSAIIAFAILAVICLITIIVMLKLVRSRPAQS